MMAELRPVLVQIVLPAVAIGDAGAGPRAVPRVGTGVTHDLAEAEQEHQQTRDHLQPRQRACQRGNRRDVPVTDRADVATLK